MSKTILLFSIMLSCLSFAQVTKVTYRLEIPVDETIAADYSTEIKRREHKDIFKYTDFELVFDDKSAYFFSPVITESDNIPLREAAAYLGIDKPVYSDNNYKYHHGEPGMGIDGDYLVKVGYHNWQLHKEEKMISGYKCYRATYLWPGADEVATQTAWYCPDIKSRFGPRGSGNLPGLVLEFEYAGYVCTAIKVDFKVKDKIKSPEGMKIITDDEYTLMWEEKWKREQDTPAGN